MAADPKAAELQQAIGAGLEHHGAGRLAEAEAIYRKVLESQPEHAEALHLLGVVALQSGDPARAAALIERAVQAGPATADYHNNLGEAYRGLSRAADAERCYRAALEIEPSYAEAYNNLGNALKDLGRPDEAEDSYRRALRINPRYAEAHFNLANLMHDLERLVDAEKSFRKALELNPGVAEIHNGLACALMAAQRYKEAEQGFRQALIINPVYAEAYTNLGDTLLALDRAADAERCCRQALEFQPRLAQAHLNLGKALQALKRPQDAAQSYRQALDIQTEFAEAHCMLGTVLRELARPDESEQNFRRAIALNPRYGAAHIAYGEFLRSFGRLNEAEQHLRMAVQIKPSADAFNILGNVSRDAGHLEAAELCFREALKLAPQTAGLHVNLGEVLQGLGRRREAEQSLRQALKLKPGMVNAHVALGTVLKDFGRMREAEDCYRAAMSCAGDDTAGSSNLIFLMDMLEGRSAEDQQRERRDWYTRFARPVGDSIKPHGNDPDPDRVLRIGYVSADFRQHSANLIFGAVLRAHDRMRFELYCYSGVTQEDEVTAQMRQIVPNWRSTLGMHDASLAEEIRRDRIDILVDLSGHTSGNRLMTFARKPAPVQVTAWGHATGTGLPTIDYFLADPVLVPPEERSLYAEEVVDLPCCVCYEPHSRLPEVSALPALSGRPFTFGCVNRLEKISNRTIVLWSRVLTALPGSRLLVKAGGLNDPMVRERFSRRLRQAGISQDRIDLDGQSPHSEHVKIFQKVDLGLDPFPHGGGVSTLEALWMGVPVVTLQGSTTASRLSASILTAADMPEWIARNDEEYVRIAVEAAQTPVRLAAIREGLRTRMESSVIGDTKRYTRAVESIYRSVWRRWCQEVGRKKSSAGHSLTTASSAVAPMQVPASVDRDLQKAMDHYQAGRLTEAEGIYRKVIAQVPGNLEANYNLGNLLHDMRRMDEAERCLRMAVALSPDFAEAHLNLGLALKDLGRLEEAEISYRRALSLKSDLAVAHNNLGNLLQLSGRLEEAERHLRQALSLRPHYAAALNNLGTVLLGSGRLGEAEQYYRLALKANSDYALAYSNLGGVLRQMGRPEEAERSYRKSLALNPGFPDAHANLGCVLQDLGRLDEAEVCCRRALALNPNLVEAHNNLGNVLKMHGRMQEAENSYRRTLALKPSHDGAHSNLIFLLDLQDSRGVEEQQKERRRWSSQFSLKKGGGRQSYENSPDSERRLRIGYVSADFRHHSAYYIFSPLIYAHDVSQYEVFCYSGVRREDEMTGRLRNAAEAWRPTLGISDGSLAAQIRNDRIDILVDLSGHTGGNRLLVFAREPAPVQVTAWGYATGTGLEAIDYFFADPVLVPREVRKFFAEEILDLPCCVCYAPPEYLPDVTSLPARDDGLLTFSCANRVEKISDHVIALWARVLHAVTKSRLLIKSPGLEQPHLRSGYLRRLADAGIRPDRVELRGNSPHADHLEVFHQVDLALDPYPHGGGVSTLEALWMGVPVVTLQGATPASRLSASILTAAGMPEWIAHSDDEYVRIAVEAAQDRARLANIRQGLRAHMNASVIGDTQRYTRAVEAAYRTMWRRWCEGAGRAAG